MKVVTLEGRSVDSFLQERNKILLEWGTSPPEYTTEDESINYWVDYRVYVTMSQFLAKKRNGDFWAVLDTSWVLVGYSKFIFIK